MSMFITFEGIDGSGKTTQVEKLAEAFRRKGCAPLLLREPGGTPLSEDIRALLLDTQQEISPVAELLLFSSARAQLVEQRIRPALEKGQPVICDRFYDSTTAYQGAGREVADLEWIKALNLQATGGLVPSRTYYIKVPLAVAQKRQQASPKAADRMEASGRAFYQRVIKAYERIAREEPTRVVTLDGTQTPEAIHKKIWKDVSTDLLSAMEPASCSTVDGKGEGGE